MAFRKNIFFFNALFIVIVIFSLKFESSADQINYTYDDMFRLIKIEFENGTVVEYVYDNLGNKLQSTTTISGGPANKPPNPVTDPNIIDGATEISTTPTISCAVSVDPDSGDQVVHYLYFGTPENLNLKSSGWNTSYEPGQLKSNTTYCWQIVSRDSHNVSTDGPVWCFTTRNDPPIADFYSDITEGKRPMHVRFIDNSLSLDDEIDSWEWDFNGDGIVDSNEENPFYTYNSSGIYTVTLKVTDKYGLSKTETKVDYIKAYEDNDSDGIHDGIDNCPSDVNIDQSDIDSDGIGDVCDGDIDGDGVLNEEDNCIIDTNADQVDSDSDGSGDACTVTYCVSNSTDLQAALNTAGTNGMNDVIQLVQGTYGFTGNIGGSKFNYTSSEAYQLIIRGGYKSGCNSRKMDSANTVLDGENSDRVFYYSNYNLTLFSRLIVEGVTIENGQADVGGGIYARSYGDIIVTNTIIRNNSAILRGGGLQSYSSYSGNVTLKGNVIVGNKAGSNAGVEVSSDSGTIVLANNIIAGNTSEGHTGGASITTSYGIIRLINNTITNNSASIDWGFGAGVKFNLQSADAVADVYNNIIWGNMAYYGADIYLLNGNGTVSIYHNDFDPVKTQGSFTNEYGNINADPMFIDPDGLDNIVGTEDDDLHLNLGSPCIDAGAEIGEPVTDIEGKIRPIGNNYDMGAYEYGINSNGGDGENNGESKDGENSGDTGDVKNYGVGDSGGGGCFISTLKFCF